MIPLLVGLILFAQGIPVLSGQGGTVSGTLRSADGKPAVGVRVAAMAEPDSPGDGGAGAALVSIAETDDAGRFRLENIPPGRYYIVAGRVDLPTYFPGTQEMSGGRIIPIVAGSLIPGIDFAMQDASIRVARFEGRTVPPIAQLVIPVQVAVDGGKLPASAGGGFTRLEFIRTMDNALTQLALGSSSVTLTAPSGMAAADYQVVVKNLPDDYAVKSILYGSVDLMKANLHFTAPIPSPRPDPFFVLRQTVTVLPAFVLGPTVSVAAPATVAPPYTPPVSTASLSVILTRTPKVTASGVHVRGRLPDRWPRLVYLSGKPGDVYSDGTFEFRDVPPGRQIIAAVGASLLEPLVASVVVGNRDVEGVTLEQTELLPADFKSPSIPRPDGSRPAGAVVPLASITGMVVEEATREPIKEGTVTVAGATRVDFPIKDGKFQIPNLLPGRYDVQVEIPFHSHIHETVVVDDKNLNLDLALPSL